MLNVINFFLIKEIKNDRTQTFEQYICTVNDVLLNFLLIKESWKKASQVSKKKKKTFSTFLQHYMGVDALLVANQLSCNKIAVQKKTLNP